LPDEWKESNIVFMYKRGDKTDCNNYTGISLLPTTYKILSNILLSRLIPYAEEIIGNHQCGFQRNRSTTDHIYGIRQILQKNWEHNEAVHQHFIDFKKAYDSVRREALYNILTEFVEPSVLEFQLAIEKLKSHKWPCIDQTPAELIKAGGRTIRCAIHKLIIVIWNKEELPGEWKESIIVTIHKKGDKTNCNIYRGISLVPTTYKILYNILLSG